MDKTELHKQFYELSVAIDQSDDQTKKLIRKRQEVVQLLQDKPAASPPA